MSKTYDEHANGREYSENEDIDMTKDDSETDSDEQESGQNSNDDTAIEKKKTHMTKARGDRRRTGEKSFDDTAIDAKKPESKSKNLLTKRRNELRKPLEYEIRTEAKQQIGEKTINTPIPAKKKTVVITEYKVIEQDKKNERGKEETKRKQKKSDPEPKQEIKKKLKKHASSI